VLYECQGHGRRQGCLPAGVRVYAGPEELNHDGTTDTTKDFAFPSSCSSCRCGESIFPIGVKLELLHDFTTTKSTTWQTSSNSPAAASLSSALPIVRASPITSVRCCARRGPRWFTSFARRLAKSRSA